MEVIGVDGLLRDLVVAGATIGARAGLHVNAVADDVAETARILAPRLTGALADSIEATREGEAGAEVGATVPYAHFVEYGTWKDAPQPFLGPALERETPELLLRLQLEVERI